MSTETKTELDLDAIEARVNAATAGPWQHDGNDGLVWPPRIGDPVSGSNEMADADFIAAARTDVPALVAEIKRLREQLGKPCGSCHPCMNWADETWRRADRTPPTVDAYDDVLRELERLRQGNANLIRNAEVLADEVVHAAAGTTPA